MLSQSLSTPSVQTSATQPAHSGEPAQAVSEQSACPLQLLSTPSRQASTAPGLIAGSESLQSLPIAQPAATNMSRSASRKLRTQEREVSSQASVVQTSMSSQMMPTPPKQPVAEQVSSPLQKRPSSQRAFTGVEAQARVISTHSSTVQLTPSSQRKGVPAPQRPPAQTSSPLQKTPSEHSAALAQGRIAHPPTATSQSPPGQRELSGIDSHAPRASLQRSSVQAIPSSQTTGPVDGKQMPARHCSTPSQKMSFEQSSFVRQAIPPSKGPTSGLPPSRPTSRPASSRIAVPVSSSPVSSGVRPQPAAVDTKSAVAKIAREGWKRAMGASK